MGSPTPSRSAASGANPSQSGCFGRTKVFNKTMEVNTRLNTELTRTFERKERRENTKGINRRDELPGGGVCVCGVIYILSQKSTSTPLRYTALHNYSETTCKHNNEYRAEKPDLLRCSSFTRALWWKTKISRKLLFNRT